MWRESISLPGFLRTLGEGSTFIQGMVWVGRDMKAPGRLSLGDCFIINIPGGCDFRCSQQDIGLFLCDPGLRAVAAPRPCPVFISKQAEGQELMDFN